LKGTTYTVANAEHVTNQTTATNYAAECLSNVLQPLYPELSVSRQYEDAPFLMSPHLTLPSKYVLTKTHCTGYSDDRPWTFDLHDAISFEEFCRFGFVPPREETGSFCFGSSNLPPPRRDPKFYTSIDNVHKIVHLIRSPFDNIVARMHLGVSERQKRPLEERDDRWLAVMNDTPDGLRNWCEYVDNQFHKLDGNLEDGALSRAGALRNATLPQGVLQRMKKVKCHSEIFRYTQFHNLVLEMAADSTLLRLVSPPHVMYYEDYSTDLEATTANMVEYLEQPLHNSPHPFVSGKTYGHLWSKQEQELVAELVHDLATPATWKLLERYFPWWKDRPTAESTSTTAEDQAALAQYHETRIKPAPSVKMVWLMSYPTSGALFVLKNIVTASESQILGATHLRPESTSGVLSRTHVPQGVIVTRRFQRLWPDHPEQSPYYFRSQSTSASFSTSTSAEAFDDARRPAVALTKNPCHAWACDSCPIPESAAAFERSCRIVPSADPNMTAVPIDMSRVREVLVLVRNPFDVMRSRAARGLMQRAVEAEAIAAAAETAAALNSSKVTSTSRGRILTRERASELRGTRAGLVMWCADVDSRFQQSFVSAIQPPSQPSAARTNEQPATWWDHARDSLGRLKEVVMCPSRWLASNNDRYSQLKQTRAIAEMQYVEFPVDRDRMDRFRGLPCHSDWLRMVQWFNHVMEFSRPRRTLPRQILRLEDFTRSESDAHSKIDELAESLLGRPLETKIRERFLNPSRAKHLMLYTDEEARLAAEFVKTFGSRDVWDLFRPYFTSNHTGRG
jgi:hypothetical protein